MTRKCLNLLEIMRYFDTILLFFNFKIKQIVILNRMAKKRILSGMRPTGKLHIGHYVGALENWVKLQNEYESYHLIADYHVLTTNLDTADVYENSVEMLIDWLAAGLDPVKSPMFRQSRIKEHTELFLIFSMLITQNRLERNPTLKDQVRDLNIENVIYGHLGYPVLQAADILLYKGAAVPVGEDQVPHVEITREIARKFNNQYGEVFIEPEPVLTSFARLPGLDGNAKMSKSLNNTILLSDDPETVKGKIRKAVTDPKKVRRGDPGNPEICVIFHYHKKFNPGEVPEVDAGCRSGALGCVDCKLNCASKISMFLEPIRERRAYYDSRKQEVLDILSDGESRAQVIAGNTMMEVRQKMKLG
jgi:tryptophanyl-tRNA synthetase